VCAVLEAAILDDLVRRPQQGGGSITTLLPGFVYASATVMKVCLVCAVVSAVVGLARRPQPGAILPRWGIASIVLTPSTLLFGALTVLAAQNVSGTGPDALSAGHFSQVARAGVFVMLAVLSAGAFAASTSLVRREGSRMVPILGLAANLLLVGLFWHFRFYALGFDQDLWAPR
jgi:hypothetical protein